jgi:hypothetical protein
VLFLKFLLLFLILRSDILLFFSSHETIALSKNLCREQRGNTLV